MKDIIKIINFVKELLRIFLSQFRRISENLEIESSLNGLNHFGVGVDSSLTSGDMLEDAVAVVCVGFTYKEASAESR